MEGSALLADAVIGDNFWRSLTLDRQAPPRDGTTPCNYHGSISSLCPTSIPVLGLNHNSLLEPKISPASDIPYPKGQSGKGKSVAASFENSELIQVSCQCDNSINQLILPISRVTVMTCSSCQSNWQRS